ncbi:MAG TPA: hypothetical protein VHN74_10265 [Candidatus Angelobacter sp.]|nr:hypothetical protein [Candidatus Angelobacter sp.]
MNPADDFNRGFGIAGRDTRHCKKKREKIYDDESGAVTHGR